MSRMTTAAPLLDPGAQGLGLCLADPGARGRAELAGVAPRAPVLPGRQSILTHGANPPLSSAPTSPAVSSLERLFMLT